MITITERLDLKENRKEKSDNSLNCSFSSNNSFYEILDSETKKILYF